MSSSVLCVGEYKQDASFHSDPACVPGCPVDGEDESLLSGTTFYSYPHHPPAHAHDGQIVHRLGDEMCKYLLASVSSATKLPVSLC